MKTDVAKVTLRKPVGLIKFRATQMSDNQHKIKTAKKYNDMFTNAICVGKYGVETE